MSVDGFIAGPNGEMDWMIWEWDDRLKAYVLELTRPADTIVLGRKLAEGFIPSWTSMLENPETADEFARKMVDTPKIAFSKTMKSSEWKNTEIASGNLTEEITKLKKLQGNDIIAYGGGQFVSSLIKARLIDEFHLFVNPVALGSGMRIFGDLTNKQIVQLIGSKAFDCGITVLNYRRAD